MNIATKTKSTGSFFSISITVNRGAIFVLTTANPGACICKKLGLTQIIRASRHHYESPVANISDISTNAGHDKYRMYRPVARCHIAENFLPITVVFLLLFTYVPNAFSSSLEHKDKGDFLVSIY